MRLSLALTLAFAASAAAYDVASLTPDNYDEITDGKTVFIKFFAPWVSCALSFFSVTCDPISYGAVRGENSCEP
jgi:hypothetical protein